MRPVTKLFAVALSVSVGIVASATASHATTVVRTRSCDVLQRAINRLPPSGGEVVAAAGVHLCRAPIVIDRDNVSFRGEGPATILRLANNTNAPVIVMGQSMAIPNTTRRNIQVSDLAIDGNRANQTSECMGGPCGPAHPLRNNGISVRRCDDCRVLRVTVSSASSGGLVAELTTRRLTVRDFTAFDNQFDGLAGYETVDSNFSGLNLYSNLAAGLSFDIRFDHNRLSNVMIANNGKVGIFMRDSRDNSFTNLNIRDNGEHGVFLAQVDADVTKPAIRNVFSGLVIVGSDGAAFVANDASCVDNVITAAQFSENGGGCVVEASAGLVFTAGVICR